jgi:peptide/nickel transport system substrate-binding protein
MCKGFRNLIASAAAALWCASGAAVAEPVGELTVAVANFGREVLDVGLTTTQDLQYAGHIHDPLISGNEKGELTSDRGLAEGWTVSSDARTITLKIRQGVQWHDGKPLTTDDIVFSLGERLTAPDANCTICRRVRAALESVRATDANMVEIRLKGPDPAFISFLSSRDGDIRVIARHNYRKTDQGYEMIGNPIGTGPWKFVSFERGVAIRLAANTSYWDRSRVPDFATMRIVPRAQSSTRLAMVRSGEADMAFIDARQAPDARRAGLRLLKLENANIGVLTFLGCWQRETLCQELRFRKAIGHAIDMDAIVKRVYPEDTGKRIASSIWTPPALGYDPALVPYKYDREMARGLLKEISYDGRPVKIWVVATNSSPESPEIMQLVDGYLRAAGFKTEVTNLEFGAFSPRYSKPPQNFETHYAAHLYIDSPGARPMVLPNLAVSFVSQKAGGLFQGYWNPDKIDAEYARLKTITDLGELDRELRKLNRETYAEYAFIPIAARSVVAAVGPRVKSWSPGNYGYAWNLETVRRAP